MYVPSKVADFAYLRKQTVGADTLIPTPYGRRLMLYADHIASGRCLRFVEETITRYQRLYANTHTEDDVTGRTMSLLFKDAEHQIKTSVNAGPEHRIIACGTGATGGIYRLQQILGIALPPATRIRIEDHLKSIFSPAEAEAALAKLKDEQPVVFVGPYEHHSNEISWRAGLATVVEVDMDDQGCVSLEHLEKLLEDPRYKDRLRIGSFSAGSNVTGRRTPVHDFARLLHRHGAHAFFDFAAAAPYTKIDMNPPRDADGSDPSLDAIFLSPHKFLGGPGSSGILIFNEKIYSKTLPPCIAGGGTVSYVNATDEDFFSDIEERENAGTPGTLQILKAGLVFAIKDKASAERIEAREFQLLKRAFDRWRKTPGIEILGNPDPENRLAIVSFNIKAPQGDYLHPKLVTALLNDLFGIQSRAGCACAGPYGHRLLNIGMELSNKYRSAISAGNNGLKPGWCRIGFHYTMDDAEADFLIKAIEFMATHGHHFVDSYNFDLESGLWTHKNSNPLCAQKVSQEAWQSKSSRDWHMPTFIRKRLYRSYLRNAEQHAANLANRPAAPLRTIPDKLRDLQFFTLNSAH